VGAGPFQYIDAEHTYEDMISIGPVHCSTFKQVRAGATQWFQNTRKMYPSGQEPNLKVRQSAARRKAKIIGVVTRVEAQSTARKNFPEQAFVRPKISVTVRVDDRVPSLEDYGANQLLL
jgi:hypothetical protein